MVWPRLWPALPETLRSDLLAARASLDQAAIAGVWGVLFCAFAPFTFWAIPIGLGVAATAVVAVIPGRAQAFGELMEAAYDQYRTTLYTQLRWPLPANPHQERVEGHRLTSYLWRGSDDMSPAFIPPAEAAPDNRDRGGSEQALRLRIGPSTSRRMITVRRRSPRGRQRPGRLSGQSRRLRSAGNRRNASWSACPG